MVGFCLMDEPTRRDWAARVRRERESQGISRAELAAAAGISMKTLANLERGDHAPQEGTLRAVLRALGIDDHDPQIDADTDALLVLLGSLIRRLPPDYVAEWASRVTGELAAAIAEQAEAPPEWDEMIDLIRRAENGHESGVSDTARDIG